MVFLPEACDYIAMNKEEALSLAESLDGPLMQNYCNLAKDNEIWLSLGGVHEKVSVTLWISNNINERKNKYINNLHIYKFK